MILILLNFPDIQTPYYVSSLYMWGIIIINASLALNSMAFISCPVCDIVPACVLGFFCASVVFYDHELLL